MRLYISEGFFSSAQVLELSQRSTLLVSSVMEETGGTGVDCVVDNGGMSLALHKNIVLLVPVCPQWSM